MLDDLQKYAANTAAMVDSQPELAIMRHSDQWVHDHVCALEDSLLKIINRCQDAKSRSFTDGDGLFLSLNLQAAESSASALFSYKPAQSLSQAASTVSNWIQTTLIPNLKGLAAKILTILSSLLTPTGWSLKGSLGGGALGLSNLELEIKFGK